MGALFLHTGDGCKHGSGAGFADLLQLKFDFPIDFDGLFECLDITSFPPLPADLPHGLSAIRNLVVECENRFEEAYFDHRLVDMRIRGTAPVVTETRPSQPPGTPPRTGFSYATEALAGLLGSLSPDLKHISQPDLSSRLAYLTNRARIS